MRNTSIAYLTSVMPPPDHPIDPGDPSLWPAVEAQLGTPLPEDYKLYINTYGVGSIADFIWIIDPFTDNRSINLDNIQAVLKGERILREKQPRAGSPYPIYPEPGGILPWGHTENGDQLFWKTGRDPSAWPIVVNETRSPYYHGYFCSLTLFLSKILTGDLRVETFPLGNFRPDAPFRPAK